MTARVGKDYLMQTKPVRGNHIVVSRFEPRPASGQQPPRLPPPHPRKQDGDDKPMKPVTEIRYDNFDLLFEAFKQKVWREFPDEPEKGMLRRFAASVQIPPATPKGKGWVLSERYASHLNCRRKGMGHATARKIEEAQGLMRSGWITSTPP